MAPLSRVHEGGSTISNLVHQFWSQTIDGLTIGAIYALVALGYTMVYGVLRLINFAHSEVFMLGTFGALVAAHFMGLNGVGSTHHGLGLLLILVGCALVAMAYSGATAVVLERIAYRPLRKRGASRLAALISAIGASLFLQEAVSAWRGNIRWRALHLGHLPVFPNLPLVSAKRDADQFPRILTKSTWFHVFDGQVRNDKVLIFVAAIFMMVVLDQIVRRTRLGRGIRAVAQDPETATLMGVDIDRVITLTFLLGGIMAGAAGFLYVLYIENTSYIVGFVLGIKAFTAAVLGGIGNLRGALVGGLLLGLVENYGAAVLGTQWKDPIAFAVLLAVLMARPTGLLGEALAKARA